MRRLERDLLYLVYPANAGIPVLYFPTQRHPGMPAPGSGPGAGTASA